MSLYNHNKRLLPFQLIPVILSLSVSVSCKKLVKINEPVNTITTNEAFNSNANATAALVAIYNNMIIQPGPGFANGATTFYAGLSSDELKYFPDDPELFQFQSNELLPDNSLIKVNIWDKAYFNIYQSSAVIEGLKASKGVNDSLKAQLTGEAKFLRAFCYFYLINFFGDVPLLTSTGWESERLAHKASMDDVYLQIISDLQDAQLLLPANYIVSDNQRTRANKFTVNALLARVYLYKEEWQKAASEATSVINNSTLFELENDLSKVFQIGSKEAIWQLEVNNINSPYATREGLSFIPPDVTSNPSYYISNELINAFDSIDLRKTNWTSTTTYSGLTYYFPYKYRVRIGTAGNVLENYTVFRLAEQYLIRSEARAQQNKLTESISDLNKIRNRAGLPDTEATLNQTDLLTAIANENRIEFFTEWGHRWFDLKRTHKINAVLAPGKGSNWKTSDQLYPIPVSEIIANPGLIQNEGY